MERYENWGDYFWPGRIDECRKNLLNEHDPVQLERLERLRTSLRQTELDIGHGPTVRTFDLNHLKAIHHHLFQDIYGWAGQLRVTELVRPADDPNLPGHEFVKPEDIERLAPTVFAQLGDPADLAGRPRAEQVDALARTYSGINVLHPFVEGNGRTQRAFLRQAAEVAGLHLEWHKMPNQNEVMATAFNAGPDVVAKALAPCLSDLTTQHGTTQPRAAQLEQNNAVAAAFPNPPSVSTSRATRRASAHSRRPMPTRGLER